MSRTRIHLVIPPHGDLTQPVIGVPALVAYLRKIDEVVVTQSDEGILAFEYLTQADRLRLSLEHSSQTILKLESKRKLCFFEQQHYLAAGKAKLVGEYVIRNIERAKSIFRRECDFFDQARYDWAIGVLQRCLCIISAEFFKTRLSLENLHMRFNHRSSPDLWEATQAMSENPFIEFFRLDTLQRLQREKPDIVGISVTHGAQLIPAYTLARMIRETFSNCRIVFGGAYLPHIAHGLARDSKFFRWVDAYILYEGEQALHDYIRLGENTDKLNSVGNLIYREPETNRIIETPRLPVIDLDSLPIPDFEGLPLSLYLSPFPVFPLVVSRNCYWERCTFCSRKGRYLRKDETKVIDEMRYLQQRYGTRHYYFVGDVLSPQCLWRLSKAFEHSELEIYWSTDLRAERTVTPELVAQMQRGGCREVRMGLESASPRILSLIDKGIDLNKVTEILIECRCRGIGTRLSFFVGFPTETQAELQETINFVKQWQDQISDLDFTYFALERGSIIHKSPSRFGITKIYHDQHLDLAFLLRYEVDPGPSMLEVLYRYTRCQSEIDGIAPIGALKFMSKAHNLLYASRRRTGIEPKKGKRTSELFIREELPAMSQQLYRSDDLTVLEFGFDLDELSTSVYHLDLKINEGLLVQGLTPKQMAEHLDHNEPPVKAKPRYFIYKGQNNRILGLDNRLVNLLEQCNGQHTAQEICHILEDRIPQEMVLKSLASLLSSELINTNRTAIP